jgi:hypothetical protein
MALQEIERVVWLGAWARVAPKKGGTQRERERGEGEKHSNPGMIPTR